MVRTSAAVIALPVACALVSAGCASRAAPRAASATTLPASAAPAPDACIFDRLPSPIPPQPTDLTCAGPCEAACDDGDAVSCFVLAHWIEQDPASTARAAQLYERACAGGILIACTNYGSYLLQGMGGVPNDPACAFRLHTLTCDHDEPWGCGMVGLELVQGTGTSPDPVRARALLESACERLGSFACNVLGTFLERGQFAPPDAAAAAVAYERGCRTGDRFSCTFRDELAGRTP